jgi:hypothetical protein
MLQVLGGLLGSFWESPEVTAFEGGRFGARMSCVPIGTTDLPSVYPRCGI